MGFEDEAEQSYGRPCRQSNGRAGQRSPLHQPVKLRRPYANGGFAVEFDENGLDKIKAVEVNKYRYAGILTNSVWYKNHEEKAGLAKFKGVVAAALKVHFEHRGNDSGEVLGRGELREYRMVALAYRRGISSDLKLPLRDIQFPIGRKRLRGALHCSFRQQRTDSSH
jgi:hypothetical protein